MSIISPTPLDKLVARSRLSWPRFVLLVGVVLLFTPFVLAYLEGELDRLIQEGLWRALLLGPAIIIYILVLHPSLDRHRSKAIEAFRHMVLLNDEDFHRLVSEASEVDDRAELIAFSIGAAFGILTNTPWQNLQDFSGLGLYVLVTSALMWGLLSWISFTSLVRTRLESTLFQQPLNIDIFDLQPFEPIGRNSLIGSLAFIGGSVISVLFINPLAGGFDPLYLAIYGAMGVVAVLVFFLTMRHAHNALAQTKKEEIIGVEQAIGKVYQDLKLTKAQEGDVNPLSTELNMWLKYEERLKKARTWPYNTAMLRTLLLSTLVPAIASLVQRILTTLFFN